jgi:hypothetical protein
MMLLERREEIELERDARMARRHDPVRYELAGPVAAEMAIEAFLGTGAWLIERIETTRDIGRVTLADRIMSREPAIAAAGTAMAGFAADAIGHLPARALAGRGRVGVTAEAFAGGGRRAEAHFVTRSPGLARL